MITLRELKEKAVSKQQQKLMGLALAYKRGEVPDSEVSDTVKDLAKSMSTKELEDFASTKHKGLPQKKEDNEISNRSAAMKPQTYNDPKTGKKKVRMVPVRTNIVKTKDDVVNEAKSSTGYELYHRDFSSAMQHAYKHAKAKLGVDVDPEEIDKKVAMGPRKPSKGKTNSYRLLDKGGKKAIQVQVYGMDNGKYELNMYKESVNEAKDPGEYDQEGDMAKTQLKTIMRNASDLADLLDDNENMPEWVQNKITKASDYMTSAYNYMASEDDGGKMDEEMDPTKHVSKKGDMYCVYNKDGEEVAKFDNKKDADAYAIKNHDKLMEYLEIGTDKIRTTYAAVTPGQTNGGVSEFATGTDKAIAVGAVGGAAYAAKRVKDRFNPVKVAKARSDREEKKKERDKVERELSQRRDYQKKLRDMRDRQRKQRNKK